MTNQNDTNIPSVIITRLSGGEVTGYLNGIWDVGNKRVTDIHWRTDSLLSSSLLIFRTMQDATIVLGQLSTNPNYSSVFRATESIGIYEILKEVPLNHIQYENGTSKPRQKQVTIITAFDGRTRYLYHKTYQSKTSFKREWEDLELQILPLVNARTTFNSVKEAYAEIAEIESDPKLYETLISNPKIKRIEIESITLKEISRTIV